MYNCTFFKSRISLWDELIVRIKKYIILLEKSKAPFYVNQAFRLRFECVSGLVCRMAVGGGSLSGSGHRAEKII